MPKRPNRPRSAGRRPADVATIPPASAAAPATWSPPRFVAPLAIVLLTILAYSSAFGRAFIWDDEHHVTRNETLRSAHGLVRIWTTLGATPQYYPLTHTTFWIEYHLWGLRPLGYHVDNVLLHAANAILIALVLLRLGLGRRAAWLAAALFAVHPVHVESVAWVTERKNVLSGFFYLLAALAYLRFAGIGVAGETDARSPPRWRLYALAVALFACALFSKTVTASLPAALGLVLWWKRKLTWRHIALLLPMLVAGAAMGRLTAWMEVHYVGAAGPEYAFSPAQRCLIAGRAIWFYAGKLAWPSPLIFIYPRWHLDVRAPWQWVFPLGFVAAVAALWAFRRRLGRGPLVAVLFFAGTLFPALGFTNVYPMRYSFVADHFQYLASVGLIAPFAAAATRLLPPARAWLPIAGLLALLSLLTWSQCWIYDDYETLYRDTIARNPDAFMAHNNLGTLLELAGRTDEALAEYARAVALAPDDPDARLNLGKLLVDVGRPAEALPHLRAAVRLAPNDPAAHYHLARALDAAGDPAAAAEEYHRAGTTRPSHDPTAR